MRRSGGGRWWQAAALPRPLPSPSCSPWLAHMPPPLPLPPLPPTCRVQGTRGAKGFQRHLGAYPTAEEAAVVYDRACFMLRGE